MFSQPQIQKEYERWVAAPLPDPALHEELVSIAGDDEAIYERFYTALDFGTAGLRGILGAGINRMNVCTVAQATQGFANDLCKHFENPSVCISYDSRINSTLFAETAAGVFAANGVKAYIYPELMPTPALSFAVRQKQASGGVMITASHNPAKYNGYKVYGSDGCQMTPEAAARVLAEIESTDIFTGVKQLPFADALASGMVEYLDEALFRSYIDAVSAQGILLDSIDKNVAITYTPLHGAGLRSVMTALSQNGFTNISLVESQAKPDGNFPTCPYPNPEIRQALEEGLKTAREKGSELLIATDPDCDRMGAAVRDGDDYRLISGNEMGVLLLDYICTARKARGRFPNKPVAVKTIVSTELAAAVAKAHGVELRNVLTGFKYIGEQIALLEAAGEAERYILGFEESYGYLSGGFVRDKDAVNASLLCAEMFAYYKGQGKSLLDVLASLHARFGFFANRVDNFNFEGTEGFASMERIMASLRENAPVLPGRALLAWTDFQAQRVTHADGSTEATHLPSSKVLRFSYEGDVGIIVRPSGTEPKLKIYYSLKAGNASEAAALYEELAGLMKKLIDAA